MTQPNLHLLPARTAGAAEQMAIDFLLLQAYPEPEAARFRHYDWRTAAVTFGYSQKWADIAAACDADRDFCRRPTGGGIVDHTDDWTWSLVIPRAFDLCRQPAHVAYYLVHRAIADALTDQGEDVVLQGESDGSAKPGHCFAQPEPNDVIHRASRKKVAGAALKRNKNGLLIQGSIARAPIAALDWDRFEHGFTSRLADCLSVAPDPRPWPAIDPDQESHLIDQFSSSDWNERR